MFIRHNHVMVVKLNEDVVGMIMLSAWYGDEGKRIAHHYEVGYLLQQDQWNKGIMTTALQKFISILPSKITDSFGVQNKVIIVPSEYLLNVVLLMTRMTYGNALLNNRTCIFI